jgi:flagellar biosynthesis/type III secretory pathway M-ring protein FliF/YscJ
MFFKSLEQPVQMPDTSTTIGLISTILGGALFVTLVALWKVIKPRLDRILGQTENRHQQAPYPNLRDELTAVRVAVESAAIAAESAAENTIQARREVEGLREDHRELAKRVDRHINDSSPDLAYVRRMREG